LVKWWAHALLLSVLTVAWPDTPAAPPAPPAAASQGAATARRALVREFVQGEMRLSDRDWRNVLAGEPVARLMDVADGQDVNVFGVVRVRGGAVRVLDQVRRIDTFERSMGVIGVGRFSDPPRPNDVRELTFTADDIHDLPSCRVGNCEVQLSQPTIERLRQSVDWRSGTAAAAANAVFRDAILDELRAYRRDGIAGLSPYTDRSSPTMLEPEIGRVTVPTDVPVAVPALFRFLAEYPRAPLPGVEEFFYWNTGEFGMKPTTRLNHVLVYPTTDPALVARFPHDSVRLLALGKEASESRIWAGIHYRFDIDAGEDIGRKVAERTLERAFGARTN
jgi:hypothetical protein